VFEGDICYTEVRLLGGQECGVVWRLKRKAVFGKTFQFNLNDRITKYQSGKR
jgi:hypothetical protein